MSRFVLQTFTAHAAMGLFSSRSATQSTEISGSYNTVWVHNGVAFDISSVLNRTMQNTIEKIEKIIVTNNRNIIINLTLMLTIIIILVICIYLRHRFQESSRKASCSEPLSNILDQSLASNGRSLPKNNSSYIRGYLV